MTGGTHPEWNDDEDSGRSQYAVFDQGRRFLVNILVPITAPQVLSVGQNWTAGIAAAR